MQLNCFLKLFYFLGVSPNVNCNVPEDRKIRKIEEQNKYYI